VNRDIPISFNLTRAISNQLLVELEMARYEHRRKKTLTRLQKSGKGSLNNSNNHFEFPDFAEIMEEGEPRFIREMKHSSNFLSVPLESASIALGMTRQVSKPHNKTKQNQRHMAPLKASDDIAESGTGERNQKETVFVSRRGSTANKSSGGASHRISITCWDKKPLKPETPDNMASTIINTTNHTEKPNATSSGNSTKPSTPNTNSNNLQSSNTDFLSGNSTHFNISNAISTAIPLPGRRASLMTPPTPLRSYHSSTLSHNGKVVGGVALGGSKDSLTNGSGSSLNGNSISRNMMMRRRSSVMSPNGMMMMMSGGSAGGGGMGSAGGSGGRKRTSVVDTSGGKPDLSDLERSYNLDDFVVVRKVNADDDSSFTKSCEFLLEPTQHLTTKPDYCI
jgi:hypothetical protein